MTFITQKEQANIELLIKLHTEGVITTPRRPFEKSQQQEIKGLIAQGVFEFILYNHTKYLGVQLFNLRLVNKVKGKATATLYKKLQLVIQAYNNKSKELILT